MDNKELQRETEESGVSIKEVFYKYRRYFPLVVLGVVAAILAAWVYLRYATPIYESKSVLTIQKSDGKQGGLGLGLEAMLFSSGAGDVTSEVEVLKSVELMEKVVDDLGLEYSYYSVGRVKESLVYGNEIPITLHPIRLEDTTQIFSININILNEESFSIKGLSGKVNFDSSFTIESGTFTISKNLIKDKKGLIRPVSGEYKINYSPLRNTAVLYRTSLAVIPAEKRSSVINISFQSKNPNLSATVINSLMYEYADHTKELQNRTFDLQLVFIKDRLDTLGKELNLAKQNVIEYAKSNNIVDIELQLAGNYKNLDETDKLIFEQKLLLKDIDNSIRYLVDKENKHTDIFITTPLAVNDITLLEISKAYNQVQLERRELIKTKVPVTNDKVVEIEDKIEVRRKALLNNLERLKESYADNIKRLESKSKTSQGELKSLPVKTKEFLELTNQVEYRQTLYNVLLEQREQVAIKKAATVAHSQIIDHAYPNLVPVKPKKMIVYVGAFLLGVLIPVGFAYLRESMNDKIRSRGDIQRITTTPIIGEVGHSSEEGTLVVKKTSRKVVAEQFRIMRSNLQYTVTDNPSPTILVTSSFSGEGKSFISTNIGAAMSLAGKKTVILEFDIRKPKILVGLNMQKSAGITNYLVGKVDDVEELVKPVDGYENLYVLPCGPIPPNPAELLLSPRLDKLFEDLREKFDVIVIDTAPVGMVSDAIVLGKYADCSFYLVRQNYTFKAQVSMIDDFYKTSKLPKISIVINDIKASGGYGYGGYGGYGYGGYGYGGYGYGYGGYFEEEKKDTLVSRLLKKIGIKK